MQVRKFTQMSSTRRKPNLTLFTYRPILLKHMNIEEWYLQLFCCPRFFLQRGHFQIVIFFCMQPQRLPRNWWFKLHCCRTINSLRMVSFSQFYSQALAQAVVRFFQVLSTQSAFLGWYYQRTTLTNRVRWVSKTVLMSRKVTS